MTFTTRKIKWAIKLLKSKMFVVLTDKEAAIAIDGADPYSLTDAITLAAQASELQMFNESIKELIDKHEAALTQLSKVIDGNDKKATSVKGKNNSKQASSQSKRTGQVQTKPRTGTVKKN